MRDDTKNRPVTEIAPKEPVLTCEQNPYLSGYGFLADANAIRYNGNIAKDSLVPSRSLLALCPREVWERAGEYLSVTSQLTVESRIDCAVVTRLSQRLIKSSLLTFTGALE